MSEFINALNKVEPEIFKTEEQSVEKPDTNSMSLQDMKDYFDALKESIITDLKTEISDTIKAKENNEKQPTGSQPEANDLAKED